MTQPEREPMDEATRHSKSTSTTHRQAMTLRSFSPTPRRLNDDRIRWTCHSIGGEPGMTTDLHKLTCSVCRAQSGRPSGVDLIAAERHRQIIAEGWTPEHDAEHADGSLLRAARCYIGEIRWNVPSWRHPLVRQPHLPDEWPWDPRWWKPSPTNRTRDLVKAGALIAAEIDRRQRHD